MSKELLTTEEVARRLHVKEHTARQWISTGEIAGIRVGKRWLVEESALEAYIQRKKDEQARK